MEHRTLKVGSGKGCRKFGNNPANRRRLRSVIILAISGCVVAVIAVLAIVTAVLSSSKLSTEDCPPPHRGQWSCDREDDNTVTCHLECDLGYAASDRTVTGCTDNIWTTHPRHMTCVAAVALVSGAYSRSGGRSVEIYASDGSCNKILPDLPEDAWRHVVDYVDGQLLLCADRSCLHMNGNFSWIHHSVLNVRRKYFGSVVTGGRLTLIGQITGIGHTRLLLYFATLQVIGQFDSENLGGL